MIADNYIYKCVLSAAGVVPLYCLDVKNNAIVFYFEVDISGSWLTPEHLRFEEVTDECFSSAASSSSVHGVGWRASIAKWPGA